MFSKEFQIAGRQVGTNHPTYIIAELSANHGGKIENAIRTIRAAAECGADAIKIQTYTPDTMTIDHDGPEFSIRGGLWDGRTLYDLYGEAHTPWEWHDELQKAADEAGIPMFSTPFDRSAVDFLESKNVPAYKIASFEIVDLELIQSIAETRKPIILSTGMATLSEIEDAIQTICRTWQDEDYGLAVLKCVSAYPAKPEDMNLATIPHLRDAFQVIPGLSDHSLGISASVASVVLGAKVIEKHFILSRSDGGPDSAFSLEPEELEQLVKSVREVEQAIGGVRYGTGQAESGNIIFRRSIFIVKDIAAGEKLTRENTRVIRPGHGLAPKELSRVLGRKAGKCILRGTPLSHNLLD